MDWLKIQAQILGKIAEGVVVTDEEGIIRYVNSRLESMFGYEPSELVGRFVDELNAAPQHETSALRAHMLSEIKRTGLWSGEFENRRKDGTFFFSKASISCVEINGKHWFISVQEDVTQRRATEDAIRDSEARFRTLCESAPIGIYLADADGSNIYTNARWLDITGLTFEEALGDGWRRGIHPEDLPVCIQEWECRPEPCMQHRLLTKQGGVIWVENTATPIRSSDGTLTGYVGVVEDIDERKRAEEALRESEDRLKLAVASSNMGVWEWNLPKDKVFCSDECYNIAGVQLESLGSFTDLIHPDDLPRVLRAADEALENNTLYSAEFRIVRPDGKIRWLSHYGRAYYDENGKATRMLGTVHDVTERHQIFEELRKAREELESRVSERTAQLADTIVNLSEEIAERKRVESRLKDESESRLRAVADLHQKDRLLLHQSRQAAMGEMIGSIAHQWRQPLNNLGLLVQGLKVTSEIEGISNAHLGNTVDKAMEIILHMSQTIDDFRLFFKPEKDKVIFGVDPIVEKAISLSAAGFSSHDIEIHCEQEGDPQILGCPNEFAQVVINILNNARDVLVERDVPDPSIVVRSCNDKGKAVVTILDNAGGVPEEIMGRIFDPYFSTKESTHGTGMGLFMSKTIVEKHMGGSLSVRNAEKGAEFRLEFAAEPN